MTPTTAPSQSLSWTRVVLLILMLVLTAVLIFFTLGRYFAVGEERLPNLVGLGSDEAVRILKDLNLEPVLFNEQIDNAIVNAVSSQSPEAGTIVRQGRTVAVGVNQPDYRLSMPSLVDISENNARSMLLNLNLELAEVSYEFSELPEGRIITQTPQVNSSITSKDRISVVISRGLQPALMTMPQLEGLGIEQAKNQLTNMGVRKIETIASGVSFDRSNLVSDQEPEAGAKVTVGTHVVLSVPLSTQTVTQVPSMVGVPLSQAQMQLSAAGLTLGQVTYITDEAQAAGIVSYLPSTYTLWGSPVELVVNRAGLAEPITNLAIPATPVAVTTLDAQGQPIQVTDPNNPNAQTPQPTSGNSTVTTTITTPAPTTDPVVEAVNTQESTITNSSANVAPEISATTRAIGETIIAAGETRTDPRTLLGTPDVVEVTPAEDTNAGGGRQVPFNFNPADLGIPSFLDQALRFKLEVEDEQGERILIERVLDPGESVVANVRVFGEATMRIFINDIFFNSYKAN